jgi:hypothetical protein
MTPLSIAYRLPLPSHPRAVFESDFRMSRGRLSIDGEEAIPLGPLAGAITVPWREHQLSLEVNEGEVELRIDGEPAVREDRRRAPISRSAWAHGVIALLGSAAGFVASWLYLGRAENGDPWSFKMAMHMAGWHLLLTLTLFPASVFGQRAGIRAVQVVSALFFFIHAGIAIANLLEPIDGIAIFNALSGLGFLAAVLYGERAHRDMAPPP